MWKRIVAGIRVLAGVRPAETRFDELEKRIAQGCAWVAADTIMGRYASPEDDVGEDDENCRQVARIIEQAIKWYASHALTNQCREQLRREKECKREREKASKQDRPEIPF